MSQSNIKISVIIPVYNVEKYLHECIDSVLNQDYTNLEIILVNDGSPDNSGQICDEYALKDKRIKVFHQENKGVSAARNLAMEHATGDYVNFIDSDDWINQGMYSDIVSIIQKQKDNLDVLYIPISVKKEYLTKTYYNKAELRSQLVRKFIGTSKISIAQMASACALCIRRDILENLSFQKIVLHEDKLFFIEVLARANNLIIIPKEYYRYRDNQGSVTHSFNKEYMSSITFSNKAILEIFRKYDFASKELLYLHDNTIVNFYYHAIKNEISNKDPETNLDSIKNNLKEYYIENDIENLLTWKRTLRVSLRNPKWLLIKLGFTDMVIKMLLNKRAKKLKKANQAHLSQS